MNHSFAWPDRVFFKHSEMATVCEVSATIPYHVDGSRNHLDSLLKSGNQVEVREPGIMISTFIVSNFPHIMNRVIHKPEITRTNSGISESSQDS